MSKAISVNGYCPTQDKDFTIKVDIMEVTDCDDTGKRFAKCGTFECSHNLFGNNCNEKPCPIFKNAVI